MHPKISNRLKYVYIIITVALCLGLIPQQGVCARKTRTVIDMYDREVKVPVPVKGIACMPGPTYELVFMLGGKDQIAQVRSDHREAYPLANLTNPDLINYSCEITQVGPKAQINIEEFLKAGIDITTYYYVPHAVRQFEEAGIPVFVTWFKTVPKSIEESFAQDKRMVTAMGEVLGGNAPRRASEWCAYLDEKVNFIYSRTKEIPEDKRPRVYIGNSWGTNPLATWGGRSHGFVVRLCGGVCVADGIKGAKFPEVNMEQVITWAPEVIIMDNHGRNPDQIIEKISKDPDWASIPAVKSGRIHRIPSGVFFLDKATSKAIYYVWLAKQIHPDLFGDVDMVREMQGYFKRFYDFNLTENQARKALKGWGR